METSVCNGLKNLFQEEVSYSCTVVHRLPIENIPIGHLNICKVGEEISVQRE